MWDCAKSYWEGENEERRVGRYYFIRAITPMLKIGNPSSPTSESLTPLDTLDTHGI